MFPLKYVKRRLHIQGSNIFEKQGRTEISLVLREKWPHSELFWSAFSRIRTEYKDIGSISPYSVRMQEYADQNNFEYVHFLRSVKRLIY